MSKPCTLQQHLQIIPGMRPFLTAARHGKVSHFVETEEVHDHMKYNLI